MTDPCNLRRVYCMPERMTVRQRQHLLSVEELERVAPASIQLGVTKIRITGGKPRARKNVMTLFHTFHRSYGMGH